MAAAATFPTGRFLLLLVLLLPVMLMLMLMLISRAKLAAVLALLPWHQRRYPVRLILPGDQSEAALVEMGGKLRLRPP